MSAIAQEVSQEAAQDTVPVAALEAGDLGPASAVQPDRVLPILVVLSLIVHATMFLPSFLRQSEAVPAPKEIPVEVVQLPPPPKPAAKPLEKKTEPKPPQKAAEAPKPPPKPAQKVAQPKPDPPRPAQPKPAQKSVAERMKDLLGPMPAIALPGTAADGGEAASYSQLVMSKVAKAKKEGRYHGTPGAASVSFTLGDTGDVARVELVRPSGDPTLDTEAVAMVRRGAPYPPPPPGARREFTITLRFQALI